MKATRLCVVWAEELGLPWAGAAREAAAGRLGQGRWIRRLKDGRLLIGVPAHGAGSEGAEKQLDTLAAKNDT